MPQSVSLRLSTGLCFRQVLGWDFQRGPLHPTITSEMRINKASTASGVSAGMIRRYEQLGLMPPTRRLENGYRDYTSDDVMRLRFIQTFNELGFQLSEIKELLSPWDAKGRVTKAVRALAMAKARELGRKAQILLAAEKALTELAEYSGGPRRPEAPVRAIVSLESQ